MTGGRKQVAAGLTLIARGLDVLARGVRDDHPTAEAINEAKDYALPCGRVTSREYRPDQALPCGDAPVSPLRASR